MEDKLVIGKAGGLQYAVMVEKITSDGENRIATALERIADALEKQNAGIDYEQLAKSLVGMEITIRDKEIGRLVEEPSYFQQIKDREGQRHKDRLAGINSRTKHQPESTD